jgi:hypothetical protein
LNVCDTQNVVNGDATIEYKSSNPFFMETSENGEEISYVSDLFFIISAIKRAGRYLPTHILHVLTTKQGNRSSRGMNVKASEAYTNPSTLSTATTTCLLNKDETLTVQRHQYFTCSKQFKILFINTSVNLSLWLMFMERQLLRLL